MKVRFIKENIPKGIWVFGLHMGYVEPESKFQIGMDIFKWGLRIIIFK